MHMQTKEEVLQAVRTLVAERSLSKEELNAAYNEVSRGVDGDILHRKIGTADILYYLGGGVVFLGIVILLEQNWTFLSFATKVLVTLGSGIAAFIVGAVLDRGNRVQVVASAFYLIAALALPVGMGVILDHAGFDLGSFGPESFLYGVMLVLYLTLFILLRKSIFLFFALLFGTGFFFAFTGFLAGEGAVFDELRFFEYRVLVVSVTYLLFAHAFSMGKYASFSGFLYGFGVFGFLASTLALGGWEPEQNVFWELVYPILVFGALFFSIPLKRKSFLLWGTVFLMAYILKITAEYFSEGLGWPLALVLAGLAMIGAGAFSVSLKRKYLNG